MRSTWATRKRRRTSALTTDGEGRSRQMQWKVIMGEEWGVVAKRVAVVEDAVREVRGAVDELDKVVTRWMKGKSGEVEGLRKRVAELEKLHEYGERM